MGVRYQGAASYQTQGGRHVGRPYSPNARELGIWSCVGDNLRQNERDRSHEGGTTHPEREGMRMLGLCRGVVENCREWEELEE